MGIKKQSSFQIKQNYLRRLKSLGLTKTEIKPGAPLTPAQGRLIEKFRDVLTGTAKVVKVPRVAGFKNKEQRTAKAKELAAEFNGVARRSGDKLIVKVSQKGERVSINPRTNEIKTRFTIGGQKAVGETTGGNLRELEPGETYALPLARGKGKSEYVYRADAEEIINIAQRYEVGGYRGAINHIIIVSLSSGDGKPKRKRKRKLTSPKPSNVIPFKPRKERGK